TKERGGLGSPFLHFNPELTPSSQRSGVTDLLDGASRRKPMFWKLIIVWGALSLALAPVTAEAARVSPMIVEVAPVGRGSIARVELTHPSEREFPVEVQMFRGVISEDGQLELTPADDDFLLFPTQIVVPARSQQIFRV